MFENKVNNIKVELVFLVQKSPFMFSLPTWSLRPAQMGSQAGAFQEQPKTITLFQNSLHQIGSRFLWD